MSVKPYIPKELHHYGWPKVARFICMCEDKDCDNEFFTQKTFIDALVEILSAYSAFIAGTKN